MLNILKADGKQLGSSVRAIAVHVDENKRCCPTADGKQLGSSVWIHNVHGRCGVLKPMVNSLDPKSGGLDPQC